MRVQISLGEATLFREYHPDAEALFNMTMDLKKVILDLRDKNYRLPKRVSCMPLLLLSAPKQTTISTLQESHSCSHVPSCLTQTCNSHLHRACTDNAAYLQGILFHSKYISLVMLLCLVCNFPGTHLTIHVQDIEPGRPVRPQLAGSVYSAKEAFARMKGRPFVIDTKFDGTD